MPEVGMTDRSCACPGQLGITNAIAGVAAGGHCVGSGVPTHVLLASVMLGPAISWACRCAGRMRSWIGLVAALGSVSSTTRQYLPGSIAVARRLYVAPAHGGGPHVTSCADATPHAPLRSVRNTPVLVE